MMGHFRPFVQIDLAHLEPTLKCAIKAVQKIVSQNRGTQSNRPHNTIILFIGTPKKVLLISAHTWRSWGSVATCFRS